jgi:hypothetical protein
LVCSLSIPGMRRCQGRPNEPWLRPAARDYYY